MSTLPPTAALFRLLPHVEPVGNVCPDGYTLDPITGECVPDSEIAPGGGSVGGNFPVGIAPGPSVGTTTTSETGISGSGVQVDVQNTVNLADNSAANAVQNVADAVNGAILQSTYNTNQVVQQASTQVVNSLASVTGSIESGINNAFTAIGDVTSGVEQGIASTLGGIGATIGNALTNSFNPVTVNLAALIAQIVQQISGLGGSIAQAVAVIIPEIVRAISDPIGALRDVISGIGSDITRSLAPLVQIPGAIADASTSLDSTLGRVLSDYEGFVERTTGYDGTTTQHKDLSSIAEALAGLAAYIKGAATPKFSDTLQSECGQSYITEKLNQTWFPPDDDASFGSVFWRWAGKYLISLATYAVAILPAIRKVNEEGSQRVDAFCPIGLLPPSALVDAVIRGFLPEDQAVAESARQNLSESRFKLLRDLASQQIPASQLVDAFYRGLLPQSDVALALSAQGYTSGQVNVLTALGVSLLTVSETLELLRRGSVDSPTADKILSSLHYDDAQRKALASLAFRPANLGEVISGSAAAEGLHGLNLDAFPEVFTPPEWAETAGAAEGLDHNATQQRWLSHWNIGGLQPWIALYFRGEITQSQLNAVAAAEMVPPTVLPALVDAQRPLVQFRTIASMLRLKLISETDARLLLGQHGYSANSIDVLVKYAQRPATTGQAKNAQALHSASLGIAKEEYIDGSISADQYLAILTQHGFTSDGANTELQVVNAHQALLRRKEQAQLVIDEYGAGLIDEQAALGQLAVLGLTVDELARAAHRIRAFRARNAKHPTESELHSMLSKGVITSDQYVAELVAQGYTVSWAGRFLAWRQPPGGPSTTSATAPATGPTGGSSGAQTGGLTA